MSTSNAKLTENDIRMAAARLQVSTAALKAILSVESSGGGFMADGRVKVNYEPHQMYRQLKKNFSKQRADDELAKHPDLISRVAGHRRSLDKEDADMDRATLIDRHSALESASWGMFQIMGYHWQTIGMSGIQEFVNMMYKGEAGQLDVFVRFVEADRALLLALRRHDWNSFARIYNGPNYAAGGYHTKMKKAFDKAYAEEQR